MSIEDMENEYFIGAGYLSIRPTQRPIAFGDRTLSARYSLCEYTGDFRI